MLTGRHTLPLAWLSDRPPVPAKNSISRKDPIVQEGIEGPRELLNGRMLRPGRPARARPCLMKQRSRGHCSSYLCRVLAERD